MGMFTAALVSSVLAMSSLDLEPIRASHDLTSLGALRFDGAVTTKKAVVGVRKRGDATPVTVDDQWHLGSCTKAMTATIVATFVEEGRLRWTSTLQELFPEIDHMHPALRGVTLEMLLGQRAGIEEFTKFGDGSLWNSLFDPALDPVAGRRRVAETMLISAPASVPGSTFLYSNANYVIAGAALERLTGRSWEQLISDRLFKPLGMTSCGFGAAGHAGLEHPDQPWGHDTHKGLLMPVEPGFRADNPPTVGPAGTVHCSMTDWAKFLRLHVQGFRGESTPILKAESFTRLHTPLAGQDYTPGGWIRLEREWANGPVLTHGGSNTMNLAVTWLAPRLNAGFVAVTNQADEAADAGTDAAVGALLAH